LKIDWLNPQIAEKIREFKNSGNQKVLNNALTAFYLKSNYDEDARVEFLHASFGEFMCAKRIYQSFEEWIKWDDINDFYNVKNEQFNTELYDLFGFGILNQEIIEYLFGLIANEDYQLPKHLFVRLEKFYQNWCDGKFINADGTTLSQQFMRQLKEDLPKGSICLGQNQVEIFTGLNVLVILLELHRTYHKKNAAVDIDFHPCGRIESQKNTNQLGEDYQDTTGLHDSNRLLRIIALSHCIDINGFTKTIGANLSGANLSGANLSGANLSGANLSGANLSGASLRQANLNDANLTGANLSDADMCRCDLTGSNLEKAILKNTYLRGADCRNVNFINATLNGTDLCRAYIHNADFECAELADISIKNTNLFAANFKDTNFSSLVWNSSTIWLHAKGIHQVKNIPNSLQDNLDFQDANELSEAYASLDSGEISNAIKICKQVTDRVVQRLRDPSFKAHTYNRFAWLCSLQNPKNQCRGEIISLAREAVKINPKSGTYKDTLALTIIFHPPFYMPLGYGQVEEGANDEEARKNAYEEAIKLLEAALECEDFKKLALPNMNKIRQRRKDWIKSLQSRINPFFSKQEISLLLKEEY
jgi:hypothetical protein